MENKRISVFSFAKDLILLDFIFFIVVVVSYSIVVTQYELAVERENVVETLIVIVAHISSFIPVAIVLTLIFEIGGFFIMILWRLYQRRLEEAIEQAKIEGEADGIAKNYQLWEAWNNRRIEAEAKNLPFDEPPPPPPEAGPHSQANP